MHARPETLPPPRPAARVPPRALAGLLMGLLHLALVLALWKLPVWADRVAVTQRPPLLWVTVAPTLAKPEPPAPPARSAEARTRLEPQVTPTTARPEPQAITLLPERATGPEGPPSDPGAAPAVATVASPAPLNLSLPRSASAPWRQRNPALDDPRSNTAKLTLEQKLANAMGGDGTWQEERLDLDTIRWRRGNECIVATRSRAGQLELGSNGAFRNSWLVRNC